MDELSTQFYNTLLSDNLWEKSFNRMVQTEKYSQETIDELFSIMNSSKREALIKKICTGKYVFSVPEKIAIAKAESKKKRIVYSYTEQDRFVMSLLYRAASIVFAEKISPLCFSYRQGVNTSMAIQSILSSKYNPNLYGVKMDIHAYFNSVNKDYLLRCLNELLPEDTGIRKTFNRLYLDDKILEHGVETLEYKALIPGSALGSFFANYCLHELDEHFAELKIPYARYSDDIILFDVSEEKTKEHINWILTKIEPMGLTINEDKFTYFAPTEVVEFLGLQFTNDYIDISEHAKKKIKKTIKRWCVKARKRMEMQGHSFEAEARHIIKRLNWRLYKTYIADSTKFGWAYYAFRYITTPKSLIELDHYYKDTLRAMKTGKHNKANMRAISDQDFISLGCVSFYDMFKLFKEDFGYYCDVVARM